MSSSSSRIAKLRYITNKVHHGERRVLNKHKKAFKNLSAYSTNQNTFYNQTVKKEKCCPPIEDVILEDTIEEITGNVILKISPATSLEKKRNPNIQSILGIIVPNKDTSGSAQPNRTPEKHYTIVHNVLFKTTKTDVKIIDYNREYASLPPGQVGWDDKLFELAPGFLYYFAILSAVGREITYNRFIPLVYLNTAPGDDFALVTQAPVRNNKNTNRYYYTTVRLYDEYYALNKKSTDPDDTNLSLE